MNTVPSKLDFHFLICTNARDNGKDCASKGSQQILDELKSWAKDQRWSRMQLLPVSASSTTPA